MLIPAIKAVQPPAPHQHAVVETLVSCRSQPASIASRWSVVLELTGLVASYINQKRFGLRNKDVRNIRLPPLTALRAFESAGRALSFTLAADELSVTPGAISRQIKTLEDILGIQLFNRYGRKVSLTKSGKEYLDELTKAFAQIRMATAQLTAIPPEVPLRVSTAMTFAMRWLMPRLPSFHALRPDSNLQLAMNIAPVDFQQDELDATIKIGHEQTRHAVVRKLFDVHLVAVCSPRLIQAHGLFSSPAELEGHTLLHSTARSENWPVWLRDAGHPGISGAHQLEFESSILSLQAASDGVGFAIAQLPLVLDDLRTGVLVTPFPIVAQDEQCFNLIWPNRTPRNKGFTIFRDWILREAQQTACQVAEVVNEIRTMRTDMTRHE